MVVFIHEKEIPISLPEARKTLNDSLIYLTKNIGLQSGVINVILLLEYIENQMDDKTPVGV